MGAWDFRKDILALANRLGSVMPKRFQRSISDFPGVLRILEKISAGRYVEVTSPEHYRIVLNPLFHSNLVSAGNLDAYEPELRRVVTELTRPSMVAYDIGANVGVFTFLLARLVGSSGAVYAFEPEGNNFTCLQRSVQLNGTSNVRVDKRAIGQNSGTALFDRRGGAFSGRLVGDNTNYQRSANLTAVQTASIDDLIRKEGFAPPDIVKIDVEGNEALVLAGMRDTLTSHSPIIVCELHKHLGESAGAVQTILRECGYSVYSVKDVANMKDHGCVSLADLSQETHVVARRTHPTQTPPTN